MKYILTSETIEIPDKVEVITKSRNVEVKGPRGVLKRSFKHLPFDVIRDEDKKSKKKRLHIQMWFAGKKQKAAVNTISSHIKNMIRGVTDGFKFKMKFAYAHFPIQANLINNGKGVEIKNFLGEKNVRKIDALEGVQIHRTEEAKDELTVTGNSLENASLTCALIQQSVRVKNKDIRQFLDGIYVSDKRNPID